MDIIKIIGVGLIALIIIIIVKQYRPEFTMYVSVAAGIIILLLVMDKLSAIINLLTNLANRTSINNEFIFLLIKITGIAILTEFASSVCKDSGETAIQRPARRAGRSISPLGHRSTGKRGAGVPGCRMRPERALCARRRALPPEKGDLAERAAYATLPRGLSFRRRHRA